MQPQWAHTGPLGQRMRSSIVRASSSESFEICERFTVLPLTLSVECNSYCIHCQAWYIQMTIDFRRATDELFACLTHEDLARALDKSVPAIRQARLDPS